MSLMFDKTKIKTIRIHPISLLSSPVFSMLLMSICMMYISSSPWLQDKRVDCLKKKLDCPHKLITFCESISILMYNTKPISRNVLPKNMCTGIVKILHLYVKFKIYLLLNQLIMKGTNYTDLYYGSYSYYAY